MATVSVTISNEILKNEMSPKYSINKAVRRKWKRPLSDLKLSLVLLFLHLPPWQVEPCTASEGRRDSLLAPQPHLIESLDHPLVPVAEHVQPLHLPLPEHLWRHILSWWSRMLLCSSNKSISIGLSVAGEAVDFRVWSQRAFIVHVTAANGPDTPGVHWFTAVLYFGHGSKKASWLARIANVSELVDSPKSKLLLCICCRIKRLRRHDFSTWVQLSNYSSLCECCLNLWQQPQGHIKYVMR